MEKSEKPILQELIKWGDKQIKERPHKELSFAEAIDKAQDLLQKN